MEKITRDNFYPQISYSLLLMAAVTVPWSRFLMLPIAILLLVLFVADNRYRIHFQTIRESKLLFPFFATLSLFLLSLIGAAYSDNVAKAISDWECKLCFLAAPVCLLPLCGKIPLKQMRMLLVAFVLSVTATAIGNFVISAVSFVRTGETTQFFYMHATHFFGEKATHPSYLSMYCATAWILSVILLINRKLSLPKTIRILLVSALVILPAEIILLQSKAGILLFVLVFPCVLVYAVRKKALPLWAGIAAAVGCIVLGGVGASGKIGTMNRLTDMQQQLRADEMENPYNGTLQRVVVWQTSCEVAGDNLPFGTGTGDVTDELCRRYEAKGYTYILDKRLNCHNQYLQHLVGLGIPGLLALLLFIGYPIVEGIRKKDFLLAMWGLIMAGNLLVESMLETRAGSNFIPLNTLLLILYQRIRPSEEAPLPNNR
ncbi:MAG: O-antigen ligase family protein [Bacteroidales bacterium]|nr:O-antigen ligase family protein [Bacteroidales bacterium]